MRRCRCRWRRCILGRRTELIAWLTAQGFRSIISRLKLEDAPSSPGTSSPATSISAGEAGPGRTGWQAGAGDTDPQRRFWAVHETVSTVAALRTWVAEASARGMVALDTETDGLDTDACEAGRLLVGDLGRACYVPLRHTVLAEQIALADAIEAALSPLLTDPSVLKVLQNAKFDMQVLRREGFRS